MTIDLSAILNTVGPLVMSAIDTSGTHVTISRQNPDADATVNPTTLAATVPDDDVHTNIPAILQGLDPEGQPLGPGRTWEATRYRLLLLPDVVDVLPGDVVTVLVSRDPALPGRQVVVREVRADTPGVLRLCYCERVGAGP